MTRLLGATHLHNDRHDSEPAITHFHCREERRTMANLGISRHAHARMRQRSIPPIVVEWLQSYGASCRRGGADVYYFDKKARRKLKSDIGSVPYARMEDQLDAYAVVADDGTVVTTGWRYK